MKFDQIEKLIKLLDETSIDEFKYETDEVKIRICKEKNAPVVIPSIPAQPIVHTVPVEQIASAPQTTDMLVPQQSEPVFANHEDLHEITSPMVGTFYAAPNPESDTFVSIGSKVQKNTVVCMIEAMKLFNQIEAEVNGEIVEICVENGQLIEYGQTLFRVRQ